MSARTPFLGIWVYLVAVLFFFSVGPAGAQQYPEKAIRVIVGFPPGSAIELSARALTQVAAKHVGKPLVIVNMPGANQGIAMSALARAEPDGYTIAISTDGFRSMSLHQQKPNFDPGVIETIAGYVRFKHVLFVKGDSQYAQYDQFIAHGKKNPSAMEYGGSGRGSTPDLLGKVFFKDAGLRATYVPYKGSNEYIAAVLGGQLLSGIVDISGVSERVKSGTLKLVVVFADKRLEDFPDVPASAEKGVRDLNIFNSTILIVAHRELARDKYRFLHDAFKKAIDDLEFHQMAKKLGLTVEYATREMVDERIQKTNAVSVPLIKELGLYVD